MTNQYRIRILTALSLTAIILLGILTMHSGAVFAASADVAQVPMDGSANGFYQRDAGVIKPGIGDPVGTVEPDPVYCLHDAPCPVPAPGKSELGTAVRGLSGSVQPHSGDATGAFGSGISDPVGMVEPDPVYCLHDAPCPVPAPGKVDLGTASRGLSTGTKPVDTGAAGDDPHCIDVIGGCDRPGAGPGADIGA